MRRALAEHAEDMLRYMLDNSDDVRRIVVGRKKLVRDLQMNPTTVSVVLGYLKELGLVEVNGRYAENGAQLEDGCTVRRGPLLTVTEAGCEFVAESPKARR